jgi:hypothetical protein
VIASVVAPPDWHKVVQLKSSLRVERLSSFVLRLALKVRRLSSIVCRRLSFFAAFSRHCYFGGSDVQ